MSGIVLGAWVLLSSFSASAYINAPPVYFETQEACEAAAAWRNRNYGTPGARCFPTGARR